MPLWGRKEERMRTVKELIVELQKFDPEMPVVYRHAQKGGGFIDYEMHTPGDNYHPGGAVVLSSFQPINEGVPGVVA